jgi:hypothetical protein
MSPGGFDSAGTAGSDETGASVEEPERLPAAREAVVPGADEPVAGLNEQAASSAPPISAAAARMVKRRICCSSPHLWRPVYVAEDEETMRMGSVAPSLIQLS